MANCPTHYSTDERDIAALVRELKPLGPLAVNRHVHYGSSGRMSSIQKVAGRLASMFSANSGASRLLSDFVY